MSVTPPGPTAGVPLVPIPQILWRVHVRRRLPPRAAKCCRLATAAVIRSAVFARTVVVHSAVVVRSAVAGPEAVVQCVAGVLLAGHC